MSKTTIWSIIIVLILVAVGVWFYTTQNSGAPEELLNATNSGASVISTDTGTNATSSATTTNPTTPSVTSTVKGFTINGSNFVFAPSSITVNKGDRVRIVFKNTAGQHDLRIDEFKVATKKIGGGQEEVVEFTADKSGSFEYYCSVGEHRAMGMKGILTVK